MDVATHPSFADVPNSDIRSINDQRYFAIEYYLKEKYPTGDLESHEYVIITDSHDVTFLKNPFEFMRGLDAVGSKQYLYVGEEYKPDMGAYIWNKQHWKRCFNEDMPYTTNIFSAGIIGGHISVVKKLLRTMNSMFLNVNVKADCNMNVLQKIILSDYKDDVISGFPLHTKFKEFEKYSEAYIQHK